MSSNSIYEIINIDTVINEIKLTLSADPNTSFIIVEGVDDVNFFRHHCSQDVIIRESYKGKLGVYQIINIYSDKASVIGICDCDYDDTPLPTHVFAYDFSCLETMLLANNKTRETVFTQLNLKDKVTLEEILNQLSWLSHLRQKSFQENLAIKFNGLSISLLFDCTCGIKKDSLIMMLNKVNNTPSLLTEEQVDSINNNVNLAHTLNDLLNITHGHDLLNLIQSYHAYYITSKSKISSVSDIRALLYCTYAEKFNTSKLYSDVYIYSQSVNIKFWKYRDDANHVLNIDKDECIGKC